MINFIYNLSSFSLFTIILLIIAMISLLSFMLVTRLIPVANRYHENNVMGQILNLVGIIYAIILGFIVLYELNNFNQVSNAEEKEANRVLSIYREANFLPNPLGDNIQQQIKTYVKIIISEEWPALTKGEKNSDNALAMLNMINSELHAYIAPEKLPHLEHLTLDNIYVEIINLYKDREERIALENTAVNTNVWFVLIIGTFLIIIINSLFGMKTKMHIASMSIVALILSSVIFLIIVLDRPYRGTFAVTPKTFELALAIMNNSQNSSKKLF